MKICVVGCGALGSFYGAKLSRAGQEVHFLLRSDYEVVRRKGVWVRSPEGDFHVNPKCARTPQEVGRVDLVLIGLKSTANSELPRLLTPIVDPATTVLTLQNGLGNEECLARLFPSEQIMGGLCFVCLNRVESGLIHHIDHGRVVLGEFRRWPEPRTHDIASMFRHAGIPCKVAVNLATAHWEKLVWNIPFNGLGVASCAGLDAVRSGAIQSGAEKGACLTTDQLLANPGWESLIRELMGEVITAARAIGYDLGEQLVELNISRTRSMGPYKASTLVDFERGQPLELEALFLEPHRQARQAGAETPRLEALCSILQQLNPVANI
ncbi:MAG TPA: 2-dehydropantoate 2-reductase [Candidatus Saccharimonadales bacterium]|nr:2-dehydropantoate 2-reductase [Candidatus Saccharimonadales bacterium]